MQTQPLQIGPVPALVWGAPQDKCVLAVHGRLSNKADAPIALLAEIAARHGWQALSYDLPGHGGRASEPEAPTQACARELARILSWARPRWQSLGLFAVSMGAYLALQAFSPQPPSRAWLISPVVDMAALVDAMMAAAHISPAQLQAQRAIPQPGGPTLYWDDYQFLHAHPPAPWPAPTRIITGENDPLGGEILKTFARQGGYPLTTLPGAGHYLHTPEEMAALQAWLETSFADD